MKYLSLIALIWLAACSEAEQPPKAKPLPWDDVPPAERHFGTWEGTDRKGVRSEIRLDPSGFAFMTIEGKKIGGSRFEMNGRYFKLTYKFNRKPNPDCLDIIMHSLDDNREVLRYLGITEYTGPNEMHFCLNIDNWEPKRPTSFVDERNNHCITLKRVSE